MTTPPHQTRLPPDLLCPSPACPADGTTGRRDEKGSHKLSFTPTPDVTSGRRSRVSPSPPPRVEPETFPPYPDSCRRSEQLNKDLPAHVLAQIQLGNTQHRVQKYRLRHRSVVKSYMFGFVQLGCRWQTMCTDAQSSMLLFQDAIQKNVFLRAFYQPNGSF